MIPKIIHYCWLGPNELPEDSKKFISGWNQLHPDFVFRCWNEENIPRHPIVEENMKAGMYAFASDYVRLWALKEYGGIYMDVDMELIRPLNDFLNEECFVGFQYDQLGEFAVNNGIIGSLPGNSFIKDCIQLLEDHGHTPEKPFISPKLTTQVLLSYGLKNYGEQVVNGVTVYPREVFYPKTYYEHLRGESPKITEKTISIHHFHASWINRHPSTFKLTDYVRRFFSLLRALRIRFLRVN